MKQKQQLAMKAALYFFFFFVSFVLGSEVRPGSLSRNIKSISYPKLRRFLMQTVNNELLLDAFMASRVSLGEHIPHQDLHNALKVAAWYAVAPESFWEKLKEEAEEESPSLNLDLLFGKRFVWAETEDVPFLDPFGPGRNVDSLTESVFKRSLEEEWQPIVRFVLNATVVEKQTDFPLQFNTTATDEYKLYLVNEDIVRGEDDVFYRFANEDYAPILGKDMGEDVLSLVYLLQRPTSNIKEAEKKELTVNPIFVVISALFFGAAVAVLLLKK